jgi:hypothetical protein
MPRKNKVSRQSTQDDRAGSRADFPSSEIKHRCRANVEQMSQSRPDSGLGLSNFQFESLYSRLSCSLLARQRKDHELSLRGGGRGHNFQSFWRDQALFHPKVDRFVAHILWNTILSSQVKLHDANALRALFSANLFTQRSDVQRAADRTRCGCKSRS